MSAEPVERGSQLKHSDENGRRTGPPRPITADGLSGMGTEGEPGGGAPCPRVGSLITAIPPCVLLVKYAYRTAYGCRTVRQPYAVRQHGCTTRTAYGSTAYGTIYVEALPYAVLPYSTAAVRRTVVQYGSRTPYCRTVRQPYAVLSYSTAVFGAYPLAWPATVSFCDHRALPSHDFLL
eukprot:gene8571-biopygen3937